MSSPFPKRYRLLQRREFILMVRRSERSVGRLIVVDILPNHQQHTRLGITVTRRFGKAPQRNRFKRMVREAFRLAYPNLPQGWDFVVKPRHYAKGAKMPAIQEELLQLAQQAL